MNHKQVTIYTDGSCYPNPGSGGWAAILVFGEKAKVVAGFERNRTTNKRMEVMAVVGGLNALREPCVVTVVTDSTYVINGIMHILGGTSLATNVDLWQQAKIAIDRHPLVTTKFVRGHDGNNLNELADSWAAYSRTSGMVFNHLYDLKQVLAGAI